MFLNKTPPAWAKGLSITIKDLCTITCSGFITADELIKSHTPGKHIYNLGYLDYLETLKRISKDWQNKIKQNTVLPERDTINVVDFLSKKKKTNGKKRTLSRHNARIFTVLCTKER